MINLYVDNIRRCPDGFIVARNYDEAIGLLNNKETNILLLDHDLGIDENGVETNVYEKKEYDKNKLVESLVLLCEPLYF